MRLPGLASRRRRALAVGVLALSLVGCTLLSSDGASAPAVSRAPDGVPAAVTAEPTVQPDHMVNLTLYFRAGEGSTAYLSPVVREVPVDDDLPLRALELLLAGPVEEDGTLSAALPTSTAVRELTVEGGTAHVDLSAAVIRDASSVGASPANEILALAALANTLTEFPSIERVAVSVEGRTGDSVQSFWGGWGLPAELVRDESLVGQASGEGQGPVDLARFSADGQQVGSSDAAAVQVAGIRIRDRISHTRFTIELADAVDPGLPAKVPPARARMANADIVIQLASVVGTAEPLEDLRLDTDPAAFDDVRIELDEARGTMRLVLSPVAPRPYWLHTLTNPTRIVLDVKK